MNKLCIHERMCTPCFECVRKCVRWCRNTYLNIHTCKCRVTKNTCLNARCTLHKNAHAPAHARLCNGAKSSLPWKLLRTVLSLVQTSCRLSSAVRLAAVSTKPVARRCSLKKTVQIHASPWQIRRCGVAQASFDHPHWCRPHPVCLLFALLALLPAQSISIC